MTRGPGGADELEFLQALMKRGFVTIPRLVFDYAAHLGLDYDTIGKLFAIMACMGIPGESAFGSFVITRKANPHDFDQVRRLLSDLEQKDLVLIDSESEPDQIAFSFGPMFARLRAAWGEDRQRYEEEAAVGGAVDPAVLAAQQAFGRPLNPREVEDILDWVDSFGFDADVVHAVIREGLRSGATRMGYYNQIARQWYEEGVRTPEDAEQYTQRYRKAAGKHKAIVQYMGLNRQLTPAEQALLDKWTEEWGFSNEVVIRAGEMAAGSRNPLQYMNRVLETWREKGIRTVADVDVLEQQRRVAPAADKGARTRSKAPAKSNVFLQREKKDDKYYDHIFRKFDD